MITQEMHIEIDLELQKLNSQYTKNILSQEKDWFLNNEVIKFLKQRKSPNSNIKRTGFQDTAKRVEDLKELIKVKNLPVSTDNAGESYITLPPNYFDYVRLDAYLSKDCDSLKASSTSVTYYKTVFDLNLPDDTSLTTFSISVTTPSGTTSLFNINTLPTDYLTNDEFKKQQFLLIKALLIQLPDTVEGVFTSPDLYWEREGYNYRSEAFTLITTDEVNYVTVDVNGTVTNYNTTNSIVSEYDKNSLGLISSMRIVDDEFQRDIINSSLSKSTIHSPISVLREGVAVVTPPKSAILGRVDLVYICKPTLIDLVLGSNLNVSTKVAKEIVSNTIRFLKALVDTNNYQAYTQENILIE